MKKVTLIAVTLALMCAAPVFAQGPFTDVPADHWAYEAVNTLQENGVLIGYPDGTFAGKRTITRYEFAVAIARLLDVIEAPTTPAGGISREELNRILQDYAKKSDLPTVPGNLATKDDIARLQRLIDEFQEELADLGVQVDAIKRDLAALEARVCALEVEQRRVRFTGEVNVFGIANNHRGGLVPAFDRDDRVIPTDATLGRTIGVVRDFDLNVVGRVSDTVTANATINYGNYLNYLVAVDDYVGGVRQTSRTDTSTIRGLTHDFVDAFFPYYLYVDAATGFGQITAGRFPLQFTPYTLKKIDVDSYTSILKTDSGNYPVDGIKTAFGLGGVNLTLYAAKHDENDYLVNGLTGQPTAGITNDINGGPFHVLGGHSVGGLPGLITQSAGLRGVVGIPWAGSLGFTFYQAWSQEEFNALALYDQARVFGADITIPFFQTWNFAGSWTRSDSLVRDGVVGVDDIDDDNVAWDAKINAAFGRVAIGAGYKDIGFNFAAAGAWDKIGRWTNPVNVKGPYADVTIPVMNNVNLVLNGEFLTIKDTVVGANTTLTEDDEVIKAEGGLRWGLSDANSLALGVEWVRYNDDETDFDATEVYYNIGWAHKISPNAGFRIGYQFINYDREAFEPYGPPYRAGQGVVQFGVSF